MRLSKFYLSVEKAPVSDRSSIPGNNYSSSSSGLANMPIKRDTNAVIGGSTLPKFYKFSSSSGGFMKGYTAGSNIKRGRIFVSSGISSM